MVIEIASVVGGSVCAALAWVHHRQPSFNVNVPAVARAIVLMGLMVVACCLVFGVSETEPNESELNANQSNESERNATQWRSERSAEYMRRYNAVVSEIGPPPVPNAVPVLGYKTKGGVVYPSRWRTPPNATQSDNLK